VDETGDENTIDEYNEQLNNEKQDAVNKQKHSTLIMVFLLRKAGFIVLSCRDTTVHFCVVRHVV
jgi:hypothetical protein